MRLLCFKPPNALISVICIIFTSKVNEPSHNIISEIDHPIKRIAHCKGKRENLQGVLVDLSDALTASSLFIVSNSSIFDIISEKQVPIYFQRQSIQ